jgi:hypothetical protein
MDTRIHRFDAWSTGGGSVRHNDQFCSFISIVCALPDPAFFNLAEVKRKIDLMIKKNQGK